MVIEKFKAIICYFTQIKFLLLILCIKSLRKAYPKSEQETKC